MPEEKICLLLFWPLYSLIHIIECSFPPNRKHGILSVHSHSPVIVWAWIPLRRWKGWQILRAFCPNKTSKSYTKLASITTNRLEYVPERSLSRHFFDYNR
jgi:hypothetical protein